MSLQWISDAERDFQVLQIFKYLTLRSGLQLLSALYVFMHSSHPKKSQNKEEKRVRQLVCCYFSKYKTSLDFRKYIEKYCNGFRWVHKERKIMATHNKDYCSWLIDFFGDDWKVIKKQIQKRNTYICKQVLYCFKFTLLLSISH